MIFLLKVGYTQQEINFGQIGVTKTIKIFFLFGKMFYVEVFTKVLCFGTNFSLVMCHSFVNYFTLVNEKYFTF